MADDSGKVEEIRPKRTDSAQDLRRSTESQHSAPAVSREAAKPPAQDEKAREPVDRYDKKEARCDDGKALSKDYSGNLDSFRSNFMNALKGPGKTDDGAGPSQKAEKTEGAVRNESSAVSLTESNEKGNGAAEDGKEPQAAEGRDGAVITKKPDGSTVREYSRNGDKVTETTQEKDGAKISQVVTRREDGSYSTVTTTDKNGIVDRTVSETKISDKRIEDLVSREDREALEKQAGSGNDLCTAVQPGGITGAGTPNPTGSWITDTGSDPERGKTEVTSTTRTITDNTKKPPTEKTVMESTKYAQTEKIGENLIPPEGMDGIDRANSGKTLSVTETKMYDSDGKVQTVKDVGAEQVIKGRGEDGQDVNVTRDNAIVSRDGKKEREISSTEYKGFDRKTMGHISGVDGKDEFMYRLQGDTLNYRDMTIRTYQDGKDPKEVRERSLGDYEHPDQDGRTVRRIDQDGKKFWNYTKVDEQGNHTQSQTVIEGTEASIISDSRKNYDGTFRSETKAYNGREMMEHTLTERRLVDAQQVRGDDGYKKEFLKANGDGRIFEDRSFHQKWNTDKDGEMTDLNTTDVRSYTTKDGKDTLTSALSMGKGGIQKTSIMQDSSSDTPARVKNEGDGSELSINSNGDIMVNGKKLSIPGKADDNSAPNHNTARSGTDSLKSLFDGVKKYNDDISRAGRTVSDLPGSVTGTLGGLGVAMGSLNLYKAIREGKAADAVNSGGEIASGFSAMAPIVESSISSAALKSAVGVGGKVLGGAGSVIGIGYGAYEIGKGKTVDGILDMGAGAGAGAVLLGTAAGSSVIPVAGWVVAGVCIGAKIGYDIYSYFDKKDDTAKLQI